MYDPGLMHPVCCLRCPLCLFQAYQGFSFAGYLPIPVGVRVLPGAGPSGATGATPEGFRPLTVQHDDKSAIFTAGSLMGFLHFFYFEHT